LAYKFLINAPKGGSVKLDDYSIEKMDNHNRWLISYAVLSLRDSTLRTIWVRREIDKITAMIYFIIVILTFILALFLHQDFQNKFLAALQGDNQTGSGDGETISSDGGTVASEQGQEEQQLRQSVQEVAATGTATTQTTGKDLVIRHLRAAIAAAQANDNETAMAEIDSALEALSQREDEGDQWARLMIIGGFSLIALGAVSYMVYRRLRHLRQYARTAFQYLMTQLAYRTTRRTIKIEDLTFKESLQEVQRLILSQNKEITLQDLLIIFKENVLDRNGQYNDLRPVITTPKQVNVTDAEGTTISTTEGLLAEWQFTSFGPAKLFSLVVLTPDKNTGYTVAIQGRPASEMPTIPPEVQQIMNSFELVVT
jgi:hypothetical protein